MSLEGAAVIALSIASTLAAGVAADLRARAGALDRRGLGAVLAANLLVLPLLAAALVGALELGPAGAGLIVVAAAPGGSTGPLLAVVAGGDAALAAVLFVVLTVTGTVAALVAALAFDVGEVAAVLRASLVVMIASLTPLLAGVALRALRPALARRIAPTLSRLSLALLVITIGLLAIRHSHLAAAADLVAATILVAASLLPGLLFAGRGAGRAVAIAQVSAVRNLTLALVVLAVIGAPPAATGAVLGYGLVMYVATGLVAALARRKLATG